MIVWVNVSATQALPQQAPKDVIEELWGMAVRGGLLTPKGWKRAGDYFTDPTPWTTNMTVVAACVRKHPLDTEHCGSYRSERSART